MKIEIDGQSFEAVLETDKSPATCAAFRQSMPFESKIVHVRWSGEAVWIPLGDMDFSLGDEDAYEDATAYPAPGQILLYPKGRSETEILRIEGGHAGRQPLCQHHRRSRKAAQSRCCDPVGRCQVHPLRALS